MIKGNNRKIHWLKEEIMLIIMCLIGQMSLKGIQVLDVNELFLLLEQKSSLFIPVLKIQNSGI